jgi:LPS-assembly protein|tara:strand:- start:458 stop:3067 length:2610 start_codon:yes stop_codon:yes gene_type:complete
MKNKIFKFAFIIFFLIVPVSSNSQEQFNFDITQIDILQNGNKFVGTKRGTITSNNGIEINADEFEYDKKLNVLKARGNVQIVDEINNYEIFSQNIIYEKNNDFIYTNKKSKALDTKRGIEMNAEIFEYNILKNIITGKNNATLENKLDDYKVSSNFISYLKNQNKIFTKGKTFANIYSKYKFSSENVVLLTDLMELISENKTTVTDNSNLYKVGKFSYLINEELLKGTDMLINTNYNLPTSDKFYFKTAVVDFKDQSFYGTDPTIKVKKDIFDDIDNDPRIIGISATSDKDRSKISKGVFTSCKQNDNCTPWSIKAREIIHDKNKREIFYNNAVLKIYDFPVLYFPKFFHPDPTVDRRSGFLKPQLNNSNVLGNSFSIPYYSVLAQNKDLTTIPFIFENNLQMVQNEYREINKNSNLYANFGFVNNYKSTLNNKKNSIFNLFANYDLNLDLENYSYSNLFLSIEKVTNDTFLKVFDTHFQDNILKPKDYDNLKNEIKISLTNENYSLKSGLITYENLQKINSDRYEYIFPYYDYNTKINYSFFGGEINFSSSGSNIINNTNQLKSNINNNINYNSREFTSFDGVQSFFSINTKNLNTVGKNNSEYKSSPQIEILNELNYNLSYPLLKQNEYNINYLTPKALLKINPSDMKNYSTLDRVVNVNNIFNHNRLGLDSFESGRSLTLGLDFKKENSENLNKFFEIKLASVFRDKEENFMPKKSTLNKKNSNLFGSINNNFSDFFNINYNFAINNNYNSIEYSNLSTRFNMNNFTTEFDLLKENGEMGNSNFIENNTSYRFDDQNFITFKTRRNRKLNLTEYYDLVYEYRNDCLSAGIKYNKTYYEDRDLKPSENLFFTISLIPLTSYEQKIDR